MWCVGGRDDGKWKGGGNRRESEIDRERARAISRGRLGGEAPAKDYNDKKKKKKKQKEKEVDATTKSKRDKARIELDLICTLLTLTFINTF